MARRKFAFLANCGKTSLLSTAAYILKGLSCSKLLIVKLNPRAKNGGKRPRRCTKGTKWYRVADGLKVMKIKALYWKVIKGYDKSSQRCVYKNKFAANLLPAHCLGK